MFMQSASLYPFHLEAMPEMAYIRDCHNRLEYVNPAIAHQLRRDATGELCHRAIYRRDQPRPVSLRALHTGR